MPDVGRYSTRPLYFQVRDLLVQRITTGEWKPGLQIPNEIEIGRELGVSVGTVRKAMEAMEAERLVVRHRGRGTFVTDQTSDSLATRYSNIVDANGRRIKGSFRTKRIERGAATPDEVSRLGLRSAEEVLRVRRVRSVDNLPIMTSTCTLPLSRFRNLPEDIGTYRITALSQLNGIVLGDAEEQVTIASAGPEEAADLETTEGTPCLRLDRVIYSVDGWRVEWRTALCNLRDGHYSVRIA